jgi:hypothetical protein
MLHPGSRRFQSAARTTPLGPDSCASRCQHRDMENVAFAAPPTPWVGYSNPTCFTQGHELLPKRCKNDPAGTRLVLMALRIMTPKDAPVVITHGLEEDATVGNLSICIDHARRLSCIRRSELVLRLNSTTRHACVVQSVTHLDYHWYNVFTFLAYAPLQ